MSENGYLEKLESGLDKSKEVKIQEAEDNLALHIKGLEWLKRELDAQKAIFKVIVSKPKPVDIEFEYMNDEEFWKQNKILTTINHEREVTQKEQQIKQFEKTIDMKKEELQRLKGE